MLVDNIKLTIRAGDGGNGAATFRRNGQTAKGGPDGGNGGNGGNVYVIGSHNLTDLREFRYKKAVVAKKGVNGKRQNMHGKNAPHITIQMPWGTKITNLDTCGVIEVGETTKPMLLAQGGRGGLGNTEFKTATNQAPDSAEPGEPGEVKNLLLELSLIADVGLIGLPNAGKSSLLTVLTNATPAIGAYPFTTLDATIGMLDTYPIADIPGLIEGASGGKGLGISFLRHIEKTKILLHCIDVTLPDLLASYETIRSEFGKFDPKLLEKPEYIILSKVDLADTETIAKAAKLFTNMGKIIFASSIYEPERIEELKKVIIRLLKNAKA